jgi:2-polyprenyl-3-methyl-5-hydroxy-6-metoxy-1,4-benzoquinol methylase
MEKMKKFYDTDYYVSNARRHVIKFGDARVRKIYDFVEGDKILDIGCGDGTISAHLLGRNKEVAGVDISKKAIVTARKRGIDACVCNVESQDLPFKSHYFDCVIAGEIIEHLFDTDAFIDKCKRVLKKNGVLIITVPNCASLRARISLLLGRQPAWVEYRAEGGAGHIRAYTLKALVRQLEEHKFKVEGARANVVKIPFIGSFSVLGDLFPSFGDGLVVKARSK